MKKMLFLFFAIAITLSSQFLKSGTSQLPEIRPNDKGGFDYIFNGGPGIEYTQGSEKKIDCKDDPKIHCKTVSTRVKYDEYIPKGTDINIWITKDEAFGGVGYINAKLLEDFDDSQPISFEVNENTQTIHDKQEYESLKSF